MFCGKCGTQMEETALFCPSCGEKTLNESKNNINEAEVPPKKENIEEEGNQSNINNEKAKAQEKGGMPKKTKSKTTVVILAIAIGGVALLVGIWGILTIFTNSFKLEDYAKDMTVEYGVKEYELIGLSQYDFLDSHESDLSYNEELEIEEKFSRVELIVPEGLETNEFGYLEAGTHNLKLVYEGKEVEVNLIVEDTTAPAIKLISEIEEIEGVSKIDYEKKVTVTELSEYELTFDDSKVKLNTPGTYTVVAKAVDSSGNEGTLNITVKIEEKQTGSSSSSSSSVSATCSQYHGATHFNSSSAAASAASAAAQKNADLNKEYTEYRYFQCRHGKWIGYWEVPQSEFGGYL